MTILNDAMQNSKVGKIMKAFCMHRAMLFDLPSPEEHVFEGIGNLTRRLSLTFPRKNWERIVWPASNTYQESIPEAMDRLNSRIQYVVLKLEFNSFSS